MLSISFENVFRSGDGESVQLSPPSGFAFTPQGYLVLADDFNHRIQIYDGDQLLRSFGEKGKKNGQFNYPKGVAVDTIGNIYVADSWNHRIQKFDSAGGFIIKWGFDDPPGSSFSNSRGVAVAPDGSVYVTEQNGNSFQKWSVGP